MIISITCWVNVVILYPNTFVAAMFSNDNEFIINDLSINRHGRDSRDNDN
jgi:hypothetical protein